MSLPGEDQVHTDEWLLYRVLQQQAWCWVLQGPSRFGSAIHHCTSAQRLREGKAWFQLVRCLLACQAENPSSHQAVAWCSSQLCPIRQRQMPKTPLHGILRTPAHLNSWLLPRVYFESDVSLQYQASIQTSVYNPETSPCVSVHLAFPEEHSPVLIPHPPSLEKPSQAKPSWFREFPEQPHEAVWQDLPALSLIPPSLVGQAWAFQKEPPQDGTGEIRGLYRHRAAQCWLWGCCSMWSM